MCKGKPFIEKYQDKNMKTIIYVIMSHTTLKSEFSFMKRVYTRIFINFADSYTYLS